MLDQRFIRTLWSTTLVVLTAGCAAPGTQIKAAEAPRETSAEPKAPPPGEAAEAMQNESPSQAAPAPPKKAGPEEAGLPEAAIEESGAEPAPTRGPEKFLDEALEMCEAAQKEWEAGQLESAIGALDQAFALLLKVQVDDPALAQQQADLRILISRRILEIYAAKHTVARGMRKPIPHDLNRFVENEISRFQGPEREFFLGAYQRSGRFRTQIVTQLEQAGLPAELAWMPLIESGFKPRALSRARALGLWQFIPSTGYRFGLKRDNYIDERMDADRATQAAIAYLQELHGIFGDWLTVLAAYNCGESRVLRLIRDQQVNYLDNFWDLFERLPFETARYVPRFLAVQAILEDPAKYGFELPPLEEPTPVEAVQVERTMRLSDLARAIGLSPEELTGLNPELRQNVTPSEPFALKVPTGKGEALKAALAAVPVYTPPKVVVAYHVVRSGETLSHIALHYRTSVEALARMNRIRTKTLLRIGQRLRVPGYARSEENPKPVQNAPKAVQSAPKAEPKAAKAEPGAPAAPPTPPPGWVRYQVKEGDTLWQIARDRDTTVVEIKQKNALETMRLDAGQEIFVPPVKAAVPSQQ